MIRWLAETWRDLRWWMRLRRVLVGDIDRMRQGAPVREVSRGYPFLELIVPRWWDLARWVVWLRAPMRIEQNFGRRGGGFVFAVVRVRPLKRPRALGVRLPSGRTIVPRDPPRGMT